MTRIRLALAAPLLAVFLAAGCSGDPDTTASDSGTASSEPAPEDADSEAAADDEPSTDEPSADEPSTDEPSAAGSAPGAGTEYCELLGTDFESLFTDVQGAEGAAAALDVIDQIAEAAPAAVEREWAVMERSLGAVREALVEAAELEKRLAAGKVTREEMERETTELMERMEQLNTPENRQAGQAVAEHAADHCGLSLGQ